MDLTPSNHEPRSHRVGVATLLFAIAALLAACGTSDVEPSSESTGPPVIAVTADNGFALDEVSVVLVEPGQSEQFTFEVSNEQTIFFEELGDCPVTGDDALRVTLTGAIAATITPDARSLEDNTDCDNVTRLVADEDGTVTVAVSFEEGSGTGAFNFRVIDAQE